MRCSLTAEIISLILPYVYAGKPKRMKLSNEPKILTGIYVFL